MRLAVSALRSGDATCASDWHRCRVVTNAVGQKLKKYFGNRGPRRSRRRTVRRSRVDVERPNVARVYDYLLISFGAQAGKPVDMTNHWLRDIAVAISGVVNSSDRNTCWY